MRTTYLTKRQTCHFSSPHLNSLRGILLLTQKDYLLSTDSGTRKFRQNYHVNFTRNGVRGEWNWLQTKSRELGSQAFDSRR
jgi:hypothetical protein